MQKGRSGVLFGTVSIDTTTTCDPKRSVMNLIPKLYRLFFTPSIAKYSEDEKVIDEFAMILKDMMRFSIFPYN